MGATITDDKDQNLGLRAFVNGALISDPSQISLDTSTTTTYTIDYAATDTDGATATSTRTVIVGNQQPTTNNSQPEEETEQPTADSDEAANGETDETGDTPPIDENAEQPEPEPTPESIEPPIETEPQP